MTLFGNKIFVDIIKEGSIKVRSDWVRVGPKSNACPYKRQKGHTVIQRRQVEKGGSYMTALGDTKSYKGQRRIHLYVLWREHGPADTWISDFWTPEP